MKEKTIAHDGKDNRVNKRNWSPYNEELVVRGELYFDFDFRSRWEDELKEMNNGKVGAPYKFPLSFIEKMAILHQYIDYRGLEGIARKLADYRIIPYFSDYTTLWRRIHDFKPELDKPEYKEIEIASDGTGLKTTNAGTYRL
ncbi:MAG: transposase, partial [Thermoplasmata archaeon]